MSSILFYSTRKSKIFRKKLHTQKNGQSGALKSHNAEKLKGGPFGIFQHPFCRKTSKNAGGLWGKNFRKKCLAVPKKIERGDSLVSPGMVCYAEKQVKPFWSSSLGQIGQFDTIIFCRTFKNYFGQFVWIEKRVTIIVAFHFMKRRLKTSLAFDSSLFRKRNAGSVFIFCVTASGLLFNNSFWRTL